MQTIQLNIIILTKKITILIYFHSTNYYHEIKAKNRKHDTKKEILQNKSKTQKNNYNN